MKKYQYLASWDDQTLTRVGEPVVVLGDSNVSQVEVILPSNFLLDPTKAECRMYFLLPGEKESAHDVLETAVKDENGDSHVTWTIKHVHSQKGGRLAFSLTLIGDDAQWDSRTAIIPVYESRYQPESEEAEEPYTGRLTALEGSMASIRGEFAEVQDDFEELKETATLGTPIPESLVANMREGHVYIYTGTEPGYTAGHVYYYVGGALTDGGQYGGTSVDTTLTVSGAAADAKVTGDKIAEIKEDLSDVETLLEVPVNETYSGTAEASTQAQRISDTISLKAGHVYTYTITLASASNQDVYVYLWDGTSTSINRMSLSAGDTTKSKVYTAPSDVDVTIAVNDMNRAINYTITIADGDQTNVIDDIQTHLDEVDDDVTELKDSLDNVEIALEIPVDVSVSDSIRHVPSVPYPISDTFELIEGHTYTYAITLNSASNRLIALYIYNDQDQSLSSVSVNAGLTYKSKTYTATANVTAHLMLYDGNAENEVSYTATIQDNDLLNAVDKVKSNIANLIEAPIETLPSYICHTLAQRPAGTFRQGYLCLSCDDGTEGLQSYTIPMLTQKNVPCTFGLWASSSEEGAELSYQPSVILRTQEGVTAVKTAINTLGCSVAQHGNINWTDLTERELNRFFDREKVAFDALGISVKGAICPSHCVDDRVRAIVGGRFGSVRAGYNGFLSTADAANHIPGDVVNSYIYSLTGPHSNCYSYTSYNVIDSDKTLDVLKTALNYAVSQNMVMIVYWHDWNFIDSDANYVANREKLEAFIDYAKTTTVTFTTLDKIPTLK